jgi:hypothetical protein
VKGPPCPVKPRSEFYLLDEAHTLEFHFTRKKSDRFHLKSSPKYLISDFKPQISDQKLQNGIGDPITAGGAWHPAAFGRLPQKLPCMSMFCAFSKACPLRQ